MPEADIHIAIMVTHLECEANLFSLIAQMREFYLRPGTIF